MAPGLLLSYYKNQIYLAAIYLLLFYFAIYLSTTIRFNTCNNEYNGIENPLAHVECKYLLLCVHVLFTRHLCGSPIGSITLALTKGNTIRYYIASPFLFRENPKCNSQVALADRGLGRDFQIRKLLGLNARYQ